MLNYREVKIEVASTEQKELLIAELADVGYEGFVEEEDLLFAFIPDNKFHAAELEQIMLRYQNAFSVSTIEHKNWNELWEGSFEPVRVGDFCFIRAGFHSPGIGYQHEIIITPKMSFGTGHHATTFLMIEAMKEIDFTGKRILDFGTGTGVLAILAEKMGAAEVDAIDIDEWSINNAAENISMNEASFINIQQADSINATGSYNVILANINKHVILESLTAIKKHLSAGGTVLLSGLLQDDDEQVTKAATDAGLVFTTRRDRNNWISLEFSAPED